MDSLINSLKILKNLEVVKENEGISKKIFSLEEKIEKNEVQIVVLGQFKRGKSSLINSLIGKNVLPTSVVPLTSIVTVIKYGEKIKVIVTLLNGNKAEIKFTELGEYVTENKNPENKKQVEKVEIEYPSNFLKSGVQIVDTPGVGSVYRHNTDVAYDFVPKADVGIFVVTADPPISQAELQFLLSIKDYLGKILFVQNKIDQVEEKERNQSLEFTKNVIEKSLDIKGIRFYPLSSRMGLEGKIKNNRQKLKESRLLDFENELNSFLTKEKTKVIKESVTKKLTYLFNEIDLILNLRKQAAKTPLSVLKEKVEEFESKIKNIKQQKEDIDYILEGQMQKLINQNLIEDIEILKAEKFPVLLDELEKFYGKNKELGGKELSEKLNAFLEAKIKEIFKIFRNGEEAKLQNSLKTILERFSNETNNSIKKVLALSGELFNINIKIFETDQELIEEVEFKFSFDELKVDVEVFTPVVSKLPKFISGKLLYDNIKNKAVEEFDKHCGRVRYDFGQRVEKSIYAYKDGLDEILETTISEIQNAIREGLEEKSKKIINEKELLLQIQEQEKSLIKIKTLIDNNE